MFIKKSNNNENSNRSKITKLCLKNIHISKDFLSKKRKTTTNVTITIQQRFPAHTNFELIEKNRKNNPKCNALLSFQNCYNVVNVPS